MNKAGKWRSVVVQEIFIQKKLEKIYLKNWMPASRENCTIQCVVILLIFIQKSYIVTRFPVTAQTQRVARVFSDLFFRLHDAESSNDHE